MLKDPLVEWKDEIRHFIIVIVLIIYVNLKRCSFRNVSDNIFRNCSLMTLPVVVVAPAVAFGIQLPILLILSLKSTHGRVQNPLVMLFNGL